MQRIRNCAGCEKPYETATGKPIDPAYCLKKYLAQRGLCEPCQREMKDTIDKMAKKVGVDDVRVCLDVRWAEKN